MDKEKKDLLVFGYGLSAIAFIFGFTGVLKHGLQPSSFILVVCGVVFLVVTILHWPSLRFGYKGWMKVAHFAGSIVTMFILSGVFFLLFTPMGIFFRLIGKDFLERKVDREGATYWHRRGSGVLSKERYGQQF